MIYDLVLLAVMFGWAFQKIIDKKLLESVKSKEFTKWVIVTHFVLILPVLGLVHLLSLKLAVFIFLVSCFSVINSFLSNKAIKKDEISRLTPFMQFSGVFAVLLSFIFLRESTTIMQGIGVFMMLAAGILLAFERPSNSLRGFFSSNTAIMIILITAFISSLNTIINKALLFSITAISLLFYRNLSTAIMVVPTIKKIRMNKKQWLLFILSRALSTYGLLVFFWVLSRQELILTVPILAVQPLIVLLLGRKLLSESKNVFLLRMLAIVILIIGYVAMK